MTSSFKVTNKSIKCCNYYLKVQCKGWGRFDQISYFRLEIPLRTTVHFSLFYSLFPCPVSPLLFILLSYLYLPITFFFFLCFLMSIPIILGIFLLHCFPQYLSVSLAFFSVSLLSLSTLSLLTIYSFPHLDQSLCRNQVDIFKRCYIFKI